MLYFIASVMLHGCNVFPAKEKSPFFILSHCSRASLFFLFSTLYRFLALLLLRGLRNLILLVRVCCIPSLTCHGQKKGELPIG